MRTGRNWYKLTPFQRSRVVALLAVGDKQEAIAADYGISRGYVSMIRIRAGLPRRWQRTIR